MSLRSYYLCSLTSSRFNRQTPPRPCIQSSASPPPFLPIQAPPAHPTLHVPPLPCVLPLATLYSVTLYNSPPHILESSDILPSCCLQYFRVTWLNNCAFGYMILFWGIFCTLFFVFLRASLVVLTTTTQSMRMQQYDHKCLFQANACTTLHTTLLRPSRVAAFIVKYTTNSPDFRRQFRRHQVNHYMENIYKNLGAGWELAGSWLPNT